eukprot:c35598_g1_i1.p2 GENE.c35598_g1_i1~~c35598_g1_i1.p2  ORF type:complete len:146 (-),score=14.47 c35598_g1_i1:113-550(-)
MHQNGERVESGESPATPPLVAVPTLEAHVEGTMPAIPSRAMDLTTTPKAAKHSASTLKRARLTNQLITQHAMMGRLRIIFVDLTPTISTPHLLFAVAFEIRVRWLGAVGAKYSAALVRFGSQRFGERHKSLSSCMVYILTNRFGV